LQLTKAAPSLAANLNQNSVTAMPCPVCKSGDTLAVIHRHSVEAAAEHFIPRGRDATRNEALRQVITRLWSGRRDVEIHRCAGCAFAFPIPYVGGDPAFYNIAFANGGYPRERWEFKMTLEALRKLDSPSPLRLLDAGAGGGWFLEMLRRSDIAERFALEALEYDEVALAALREKGFPARFGAITDLVTPEFQGQLQVICMFQTLEHMAEVDSVFHAIEFLLSRGGNVFVSVPNGIAIDQQERLSGLWDMPPNHVGRWNLNCFQILSQRHNLRIIETAVEPSHRMRNTWRLAIARTQSGGGLVGNIRSQSLRRASKAIVAIAQATTLWSRAGTMPGGSLWIHAQKADRH
jgi:2-polyprenyl-3-methyl-5-hydroxy-6-metoxy-1,4-benzoquinol methylase